MKECGAKKKNGEPCRRASMENGRCYLHGGASLAGIASPRFRHGRYSNSLAGALAGRYEEALFNQSVSAGYDQSQEIALLEARIADLLSKVTQGETLDMWRRAVDALEAFELAMSDNDQNAAGKAFAELKKALYAGQSDYLTWERIQSAIDDRRKLVESERKQEAAAEQTITVPQVLLILGSIASVIKTHIDDRRIRNIITTEIDKLSRLPG